jgi:pyruvate kinase
VLDGTDAVMLSAETASGSYPLESLQMMDAIVDEVEAGWLADKTSQIKEPKLIGEWGFANAAVRAAGLMSFVLPLKAITTFTRDGRTASLLSTYRPRAPIIAITPKDKVASRLALAWGIAPRKATAPTDLEHALQIANEIVENEKFCLRGDSFALVVGWPPSSGTNTVKLHRL